MANAQAIAARFSELYLELGSGSGNHLVALAQQNPQTACVGMEFRFKRAVRTLEKSSALKVENTFVLQADARRFAEIFPPGSVSKLYVHFPDPWAKRKRQKNRLLNEKFLTDLLTVLKPGGTFQFKSDHAEYFRTFSTLLRADPRFSIQIYSEQFDDPENIQTEFEKMFRSQQLPIHFLSATRSV